MGDRCSFSFISLASNLLFRANLVSMNLPFRDFDAGGSSAADRSTDRTQPELEETRGRFQRGKRGEASDHLKGWDLPALIVLIVVVVAFIWKHHDMKKQEQELEDEISKLYADDTVQLDTQS